VIPEDVGLSIVILTEDSGKDGRATVEALVRRMLHLVVPGFGSHRVHFVPRDPREEEAMRGNVWKTDGKNPQEHERRVRLLRYLVRKLSLPDTFVLFHIDGDRPWAERHTSENTAKFERLVQNALPQVADRGRAHGPRAKAGAQESVDSPPLHLEHLLLICPFRSIEAWLYQNLQVAKDICGREHRGAHVNELQAWEGRRGELDELPAPEKVVCLGKAFNLELATRGFPAHEAETVKKSFAESVERLRGCGALSRALALTREGWPSPAV
jgi:hypothetical protein